MATYDIAFNIAKGKWAYLGGLPAANDAIMAAPLEASGIVSAATMRDYHTVAAVLAGATNEQTTMGRKTLTGVSVTEDDSGDKQVIASDDIIWSAAAGNATAALLIYYNPDTTAGANDASCIPLFCMDMVTSPAGAAVTYQVNASGYAEAA